jgi:hypothetical protein
VAIPATDVAVAVGGALSPDTRRVALHLWNTAKDPRLALVDLLSEDRLWTDTTLAPGTARRSLRWSPDGGALLTVAASGTIVAVNAATGRSRPLLPAGASVVARDIAIRG